jgi:aspartate/glutamate racemase
MLITHSLSLNNVYADAVLFCANNTLSIWLFFKKVDFPIIYIVDAFAKEIYKKNVFIGFRYKKQKDFITKGMKIVLLNY